MRLLLIFAISMIPVMMKSQVIKPDEILGDWISPKKDLIIRCYKQNNQYYGKIVWFYKYDPPEPDNPNGLPEAQWLNTVVMNNFSFSDNEWNNGEIYEIKTGKTYNAYIQMIDANTIKVTGYIFLRIFNETIDFTRYQQSKLPAFK